MYIGIFCGPRACEVFGLQWKSWTGAALIPHGTAHEGKIYPGRLKTRQSRVAIGVPEQVRPVIEAWHKDCPDPSPEALMFATFERGDRKGQAVPRWGKNFLKVADTASRSEAANSRGTRDRVAGPELIDPNVDCFRLLHVKWSLFRPKGMDFDLKYRVYLFST